jgi:hypothetical protein
MRKTITRAILGAAGVLALTAPVAAATPALAAPAAAQVTHVKAAPLIGSYKWAWTDGGGGTLKDNGVGNSYIIYGNPAFSSNFSRTNCGNRTYQGNTMYYCQYIDGNDLAPTESGSVVKAGNPVVANTQLWSDPDLQGFVWSWYDVSRGVSDCWRNQAGALVDVGGSVCDNWDLVSN